MAEYSADERDMITHSLAAGMTPAEIGRRLEGMGGRSRQAVERTANRLREQFASELQPQPAPDVAEVLHQTFGGTFPDLSKSPERPRAPHRFEMDEPPTDESPGWKYAYEFARKTAPPDDSPSEPPPGESRVLYIPDTHAGAIADGALEHCLRLYERWKCNQVVHLGDVFDLHRLGRWDSDPDTLGIADELDAGIEAMKGFYYHFPNVKVCIGNHDERAYKTMFKAGLPERCRPSFTSLYQSPVGWHYADRHEIDGVVATHGGNMCGNPVAQAARRAHVLCRSVVQGHHHFGAGCSFVTPRGAGRPIFAASFGCLADGQHRYLGYASGQDRDPSIGAGVVLGGVEPHWHPLTTGQWTGVAK